MNFIFWCEFPHKTNWDNLAKWLEELDMNIVIYVASSSRDNYNWWVKEINKKSSRIEVNAWPVLTKKEGYWFSGHCSKESIDKLKEFDGLNVKVDLEMPFEGNYTNWNMIKYCWKFLFKKGKNNDYLVDTVKDLSQNNKLLVNMFPFLPFYLRRNGCYVEKNVKVSRQYMAYTSIPGPWSMSLMRIFDKINFGWLKKGEDFSISIGLIGEGILKTEGVYRDEKDFVRDLEMVKKLGLKDICVYSIDAISNKGKIWLEVVKKYN